MACTHYGHHGNDRLATAPGRPAGASGPRFPPPERCANGSSGWLAATLGAIATILMQGQVEELLPRTHTGKGVIGTQVRVCPLLGP